MLAAFRSRLAPIAWPTLAALMLYLNGCVGYTERKIPRDEPLVVGADKILVLHTGMAAYTLGAPNVDRHGIHGRLSALPFPATDTAGNLFRGGNGSVAAGGRSLPSKSQRVDIWLKAPQDTALAARIRNMPVLSRPEPPLTDLIVDSSGYTIPWSSIDRISIYDVSVGKTILYWTAGMLGAMAVVLLIILLTKSSCPFVYADNGDGSGYAFQGEIFSGAIYPQLERNDWMPLPAPAGPEYRLRITNEVREIQHLDAASLWLVRHPPGTGVLLDQEGRPHTFAHPIAPARCVTASGRDALRLVGARDSLAYMGGDGRDGGNGGNSRDGAAPGGLDGLDLEFPRPAGARSAKLILRAKNSFWLDYLYGQFQDLFGDGLEAWNGKMRKAPREKLAAWFKEQNLPLTVEMAGPDGWREVATLDLPGPMASRDFLVPLVFPSSILPSSESPSSVAPAAAGPAPGAPRGPDETVRLRLRCGFLFWEIDYAALDFSPYAPAEIVRIPAASARDQRGRDLIAALSAQDGRYYDQPDVGDEAILTFAIPEAPAGTAQSAFLASRGYYDILRKPEGKPQVASLKRFRSPGTLSRFSAERMSEFLEGGVPAGGASHAQ